MTGLSEVLFTVDQREPGSGEDFRGSLGLASVTDVSLCQGIPWTKVDYFDNGIICNLIEHVSSCPLSFGTPFPDLLSILPSPSLARMRGLGGAG